MSYTIERHKRVLELKTDDKRFAPYLGNTILFVSSSSCNNVSPRHYNWSVMALDHCRDWDGNILVPDTIWRCGAAADGGGIKPWGKETSGLAYVKSWKLAVKNRTPIDGWKPHVTIWCGTYGQEAQELAKKVNDSDVWTGHNGPELHGAFKRLFPGNVSASSNSAYVQNHAQLLDAVYLYVNRKSLPFDFFLSDSEHSAFFNVEKVYPE